MTKRTHLLVIEFSFLFSGLQARKASLYKLFIGRNLIVVGRRGEGESDPVKTHFRTWQLARAGNNSTVGSLIGKVMFSNYLGYVGPMEICL